MPKIGFRCSVPPSGNDYYSTAETGTSDDRRRLANT